MRTTDSLYEDYVKLMHRIADIRYASAVLQWDQETYLPVNGASWRGQQIATLSETAHIMFTAEENGHLISELLSRQDLDQKQRRNLELTLEDFEKTQKYASRFVRELSEQINKTFHDWLAARKANDFRLMADSLEKLVGLKKEESHILGFDDHPYDPHLHEHDRGTRVYQLDSLFDGLVPLLEPFMKNGQAQTSRHLFCRPASEGIQMKLANELVCRLGFDMQSGRQDQSAHPFTTSFNPRDVRITTRIDPADLSAMIWTCIHEAGHALYEQGLPESQYGLPLGEACSFSIHESQSRLWENCLGRSKPFCAFLTRLMKEHIPDQFGDLNTESVFREANLIQPSLIRTEADEVTYHYHVLIRYTMEKMLFEDSLTVADIPAYWSELYHKYMGIKVPDDNRGCLQDVHWSHGSFGYFPTYTLGSLYAAQFFNLFTKADSDWEEETIAGQFGPLKEWLNSNIHQYGRQYTSSELCNKLTGKSLELSAFRSYLETKH